MTSKTIKNRLSSLNILIVAVLVILAASAFYFVYYRFRNQQDVYISVVLVKPPSVIGPNIPYNYYWVPYWIGNSIDIGDKEITPLGATDAIVVDKNSYDSFYNGQFVTLILKIRAIKDRSGTLLYKNKPLVSGALMDVKLSKAQISAQVTGIYTNPPEFEYKTLTIVLKGRQVESQIADELKIGDQILDNHGTVIAKVVDKKVTSAQVSLAGGRSNLVYDPDTKDILVTIEIKAKKIGDSYYYSEVQKVKANEYLYLPFKGTSLYYPIVNVTQFFQ